MIIIRETKKSGARNAVSEKLNNLTKVIESNGYDEIVDALRATIDRNKKNQLFTETGGKSTAVLAYIVGVIKGIRYFTGGDNNLKETVDQLWKACVAASSTLQKL